MSKNTKKETDDLLSFDDDYDFDDDFGDIGGLDPQGGKDPAGSRNSVIKAGKSVLRGATDEIKNPDFIIQNALNALPKEYTTTYNILDNDIANIIRGKDQIMKQVRPTVTAFKALARNVNSLIPNPWQAKINELLAEQKRSYYGDSIDPEAASVEGELGKLFGEQQQQDRQEGKLEKLIDDVKEDTHRKNQLTQLDEIRKVLNKQTSYTIQVQRNIERKKIELQVRQVFLTRKLVEISAKSADETSTLLRDIVKNTGLPDVVKEQTSEQFWRQYRSEVYGQIQKPLSDFSRDYISGVTKNITNKLGFNLDQFQLAFEMGREMTDQLKEQAEEMGIDVKDLLGEQVGASFVQKMGYKAGNYIRGKAEKNKGIVNTGHRLAYGAKNWKYLLNQEAAKRANEAGWGTFKHGLYDILNVRHGTGEGMEVLGHGIKSLDKGGAYGNRGQKGTAQEQMLSGYLSRILQSLERIRTGDDNVDRIVYNQVKSTFTTRTEAKRDVMDSIASKSSLLERADGVNNLIDQMVGKGKLGKNGRKVLSTHLMRELKSTRGFDPLKIMELRLGKTKARDEAIKRHIAKQYGLTLNEEGKWQNDFWHNDKIEKLHKDADFFNAERDKTKNIYNSVHSIAQTGDIELLRELGLVKWDGGWKFDGSAYDQQVENAVHQRVMEEQGKKGDGTAGNGGSPTPPPEPSGGANDSFYQRTKAKVNKFFEEERKKRGMRSRPKAEPEPKPDNGGFTPSTPTDYNRFDQPSGDFLEEKARATRDGASTSGKGLSQKDVVAAIREQTEAIILELRDSPMPTISEDILDSLYGIHDQMIEGVNLTGEYVPKKGLFRRGLSAARRGAVQIGKGFKRGFKGGWNIAGWAKTKAVNTAKWIKRQTWDRGADLAAKLGIGGIKESIYIHAENGLKQALALADIKEGYYIDMKTGKVIRRFSDITGPVIDIRTNTTVITQKDFDAGLYSAFGKKLVKGLIKRTKDFVVGLVTKPWEFTKNAVKGAWRRTKALVLTPPDIYIVGRMDSPVIIGERMVSGMYFSSTTNKPIYSLDQIDGDVYIISEGQKKVVLRATEIQSPGICDAQGKPIVGLIARIKNLGRKAAELAGKAARGVWGLGKRAWEAAKGGIGGIKDFIAGGLNGVLDRVKGGGLGGNKWLIQIYNLLLAKFSGRGQKWIKDNFKSGESGIGRATKAAASAVGEAGSSFAQKVKAKLQDMEITAKAKSLWERFGAQQGEGRTGAWWNRIKEKASSFRKKPDENFVDPMPKKDKWGWLKVGIGYIATKIADGVAKLKEFWQGLKTAKGAADALGSGADLLGDAATAGRGKWYRRAGRGMLRGAKGLGRGLLGVGRFALGTVGTIGRTALAIAGIASTGMAALMTGGAIIVGGYLLYKLYEKYKKRLDVIQSMRLAQYGFDSGDKDKAAKILALEEAVWKETTVDSAGRITIKPLKYPELIKEFGIDLAEKRNVMAWCRWFDARFIPVFIRNATELTKLNPKANITDVANTLGASKVAAYARASKIEKDQNDSPYQVDSCPFPGTSCIIGDGLIDASIKIVVEKYKEAEEQAKKAAIAKANAIKATAIKVTPTAKWGKQTDDKPPLFDDQFVTPSEAENLKGKITGNKVLDGKMLLESTIDDITAARMRIYGLRELDKNKVLLILEMEKELIKSVSYNRSLFNASMDISPEKAYELYGNRFGAGAGDALAKKSWIFWFEHRFSPVFLAFYAQVKNLNEQVNVFDAWKVLSPEKLILVINAMNSATSSAGFFSGRESVWKFDVSPFPGETAGLDSSVIKPYIEALERAKKAEEIRVKERQVINKKIESIRADKNLSHFDKQQQIQKLTQQRDQLQNGYATSNKIAGTGTSWENATTGLVRGGNVPTVKLEGSQKQHAENLMAYAKSQGIDGEELALLMGQVAHESGNFKHNKELGNDAYFQKYEGKKDLGNTVPGDGLRYKGRGWIQITGRDNYTQFGKQLGIDLVNHPELAETPDVANKLAVLYWQQRVRPKFKKYGGMSVLAASRGVNGDYETKVPNGMEDRIAKTQQWAKVILGGEEIGLPDKGRTSQEAAPGMELTPELPSGLKEANDAVQSGSGGFASAPPPPSAGGNIPAQTPMAPTPMPASAPKAPASSPSDVQQRSTDNIPFIPQARPSNPVTDEQRRAAQAVRDSEKRVQQQQMNEMQRNREIESQRDDTATKQLKVQQDMDSKLGSILSALQKLVGGGPNTNANGTPAAGGTSQGSAPKNAPMAQTGSSSLPFNTARNM